MTLSVSVHARTFGFHRHNLLATRAQTCECILSGMPSGRLKRLFHLAITTQLALVVLSVLAYRFALVYYPAELDYGEGVVLWQVTQLNNLAAGYHSIGSYPLIAFNYPPIYHLAVRLAAVFTSNLLVAGRWVSVVATVLVVVFAGILLYRSAVATLRKGAATVPITLFTCAIVLSAPSMKWSPFARVDMLGVALMLGAYFVLSERWYSVRWVSLAALLLTLAVYTKQTFVFGACALIVMAAILSWRTGLLLAGLTAVLGSVALAVLQVRTNGEFLPNILGANMNPYGLKRLIVLFVNSGITPVAVKAIGLASLWIVCVRVVRRLRRNSFSVWRLRLRNRLPERTELLCAAFTASGLTVALLSGKDGSNVNYFLEFDVGICLLAGLLLARIVLHTARSPLREWAMPVAFIFVSLMFLQTCFSRLDLLNERLGLTVAANARRAETLEPDELLEAFLKATPGLVLSENMTALVMAGKPVVVEPLAFTLLTKTGQWDPAPLAAMIRERQIRAVVMRRGSDREYTPEIMREIDTVFHRRESFGSKYLVYLP